MRFLIVFLLIVFGNVSVCLGQVGSAKNKAAAANADNPMPTVEDMIKTLTSDKASEASTADAIIESVVESMTGRMQAKPITEDTVKSAIEGTLVRAEVIPEVNRENVESIDTRTRRYLPRLKLDFGEFPLRSLSGRFDAPLRDLEDAEERKLTDVSLTDDIVRRIRQRLGLEAVRFEFADRTVQVSGTVADQRQRELVEAMLRMEPGIDLVKNELVVEKKE